MTTSHKAELRGALPDDVPVPVDAAHHSYLRVQLGPHEQDVIDIELFDRGEGELMIRSLLAGLTVQPHADNSIGVRLRKH